MNINREGKCTLWKQSDTGYTLRTSDGRWYQLTIVSASSPQRIIKDRFYPSEDYVGSGTLLHEIPLFLKYTVFGMQKSS